MSPADDSDSRNYEKKGDAYHHGDLRTALIDAGIELLAEKGIQGLTIREVARRVGVTHTAPYRHFKDKTAIVAAIAEEALRELVEAMVERQKGLDSPPLRYQASGLAYILFAYRYPSRFRIMFDPTICDRERHPEVYRHKEAAYVVLREAIVECQREGFIRERDPDELAATAWALVHGIAGLVIDGLLSVENEEELIDLAVTMTNTAYVGTRQR